MNEQVPSKELSPCQVPLLEQLRSTPLNAHHWLGLPNGEARNIPYGPWCHSAADELERLQRAITTSMQRLSNGDVEGGARVLRECFWGTAHEPDPVPPKEPTPEWMLKARAEGRAEFLAILLGEGAEDFPNDYTGSHSIGCTGDYGVHWEVEKLRASFVVDDATYSYIDTINGNWWSQQHEIETLRDQLERAAQPPAPEPHVIKQIEHAIEDCPGSVTRQFADYIRGCISDYRHALTKEVKP